ncbi:MAG: hypothetical protein AABN34_02905 [Acidobacteriota bacterium]
MSGDRVELEKVESPDQAPLVRPAYPRAPSYTDVTPYGYGNALNEDEEDSIIFVKCGASSASANG